MYNLSNVPPISRAMMLTLHERMAGRVRYWLGGKAKSLGMDSHDIKKIDCSGYVRYLAYRATDGKLKMPDGSWNQRAWCERVGLRRLKSYREVTTLDVNSLAICFISTKPYRVGHVWFVYRPDPAPGGVPKPCMTIESYGGHGVGSRHWGEKVLLNKCDYAYEFPLARAVTVPVPGHPSLVATAAKSVPVKPAPTKSQALSMRAELLSPSSVDHRRMAREVWDDMVARWEYVRYEAEQSVLAHIREGGAARDKASLDLCRN